jgi:hypothetical protein
MAGPATCPSPATPDDEWYEFQRQSPGQPPPAVRASYSAAFLKTAYEQAVKKYQDKYEPALWAAADHWELLRSTEHMYDSYQRICADLKIQPQDRSSFSSILFQLKQDAHGSILKSDRRSWYQFTQAMMRGYCRIVAHSKMVEVGLDYMKTHASG